MKEISRITLYRRLLKKEDLSTQMKEILQANVDLLDNIEDGFLTNDDPSERNHADNDLRDSIDDRPDYQSIFSKNIEKMKGKLEQDNIITYYIRKTEEKFLDKKSSYYKPKNCFNSIINEVLGLNNKFSDEIEKALKQKSREDRKQVFLCHAYVDKLYTYALFDYFYDEGIYLYIDWMHSEKEDDGKKLKMSLQKAMDESSQILFLRTINSELDIQGSQAIRPWCSWELGNFYRKNYREKYFFNLYSVDEYKDKNLQLHGMKLYEGINNGWIFGVDKDFVTTSKKEKAFEEIVDRMSKTSLEDAINETAKENGITEFDIQDIMASMFKTHREKFVSVAIPFLEQMSKEWKEGKLYKWECLENEIRGLLNERKGK